MTDLFVKLAFRNLIRNKVFSFVNVFGLAIGIAASLLIFQYVENELSYDKFHENASDIYRIRLDRYSQGELAEQMATACNALGPTLMEVFPEVMDITLLSDYQLEGILSYEDYKFRLDKTYFASPGLFKIFSYKMIKGNPETALVEPFSVVLSETLARKYFGSEDPIGKQLKLNNRRVYKVTGVFQDMPANTHLNFQCLFSMQTMYDTYGEWARNSWWVDVMLTYVQLKQGTDPVVFEQKLNEYVQKRLADEIKEQNQDMVFYLQPLERIHLYSNYPGEAEVNGNGNSVYFMLVISILILIIAWVNYINLSTARAMERARDVGLRKVSGATRPQLIRQFLIESFIINFVAVIIALIIVEIAYPWFSVLTGLSVNLKLWYEPLFWVLFTLVIVAGSILSGLYPAYVLSSYKPITVLKSKSDKSARGILFRKVLIVFQFSISILLIASTLTVFRQVSFMQGENLGVELDQTLVVKAPVNIDSTWQQRQQSFKAELLNNPSVMNTCASFFVPGDEVWFTNGYIRKSNNDAKNSRTLSVIHVDENFMDFYNLQFLAGRNFIEGSENDRLCHIINRKAMELLGYESPEDTINEELETPNWNMTRKIIGVIENYHQESLQQDFAPTIYTYLPHPRWAKKYSIKIHTDNIRETITFTENKFHEIFPGNTFEYFFLDSHFDQQYKSDQQFGKTFAVFAFLAITISIMGLFALALYFTLQRTREIAVRKILGANVTSLFILLSKDFFVLLLISLMVAFPVAFLIMTNWLESYAYRIGVGWWFFVIPVLIMCLVVLLSVIYQIYKSARVNPSDTLKYE
nr:ABC transporter permease [Bacteroidota bacterium]